MITVSIKQKNLVIIFSAGPVCCNLPLRACVRNITPLSFPIMKAKKSKLINSNHLLKHNLYRMLL